MKTVLIAVAIAAIACTAGAAAARDYHAGPLTISGVWSRPTPPMAPTAVGYLTITNRGFAPDRLIGADSPAAATLSLHSMSMTGGIMRMRAVPEGLTIAPGATVTLDPMSYHLMFEGLKQSFKPGDHIIAVLHFEKAGDAPIAFDVRGRKDAPPLGSMAGMPGM